MRYWHAGIALILLIVAANPAEARWRMAETQHFRIYTEESESKLRSDAAILEDFHKLLELLTGRNFPDNIPRLDIYMVPGTNQLRVVRPGLSSEVAGLYAATPGQIAAIGIRSVRDIDFARQVLLHEYAHHFMMQAGVAANPAWYVEGFAEYLMTAEFRDTAVEWGGISPGRYYQLQQFGWIPLEKLLARDNKIDMQAFYAQSWLLTHYLFRTEGMTPKLRSYLHKVGEGGDPVATFRAEVHPDLNQLQRDLRAYVASRQLTFTRMKRTPPQAVAMTITTLPASADQILLPLLSMQFPQEAKTDAASLERIRAAAARHPADDWAQRSLAIAEAIAGKAETAAPMLDAALKKSPEDGMLLRWRAALYRADRPGAPAEDVTAARRLLARAYRHDPTDWRALSAYVDTFLADGQEPNRNVKNALYEAHALAPQVSSLAMKAGVMLATDGEYLAAWKAMAPTVYNPHGVAPDADAVDFMQALRSEDGARVKAALDRRRKQAETLPPKTAAEEVSPISHRPVRLRADGASAP